MSPATKMLVAIIAAMTLFIVIKTNQNQAELDKIKSEPTPTVNVTSNG